MASAAQAQGVYRIVGPDGRVTFSDRAPNAAQAQPSAPPLPANAASGATTGSALPYALRQVAERYPVTLYSGKDCEPCDEAREYLRGRGIPFGERTIETSADVSALKNLSGQEGLPFATIGNQHLKGFAADNWSQYLNAAGYPTQSKLPRGYQAAAARPLTTPAPAPASASPAPAAQRPAAPQAPVAPQPGTRTADNPAGLRF